MLQRHATALYSPVSVELIPEQSRHLTSLAGESAWHIRDENQLAKINESIKSSLKQSSFRQALDTAVAIAASFLAAHAGTAPSHYPIFSSALAGDLHTPDQVLIQQNKVKAGSLTEFLSHFLSVTAKKRPKLFLSYHDRHQVLALLAKVSALVEVRQFFGRESREVKLDLAQSEDDEVLAFVLNGNHLPNLNRYLEGDHSVLLGWAAAKSAKLHDVPGEAEKIVRDTISKVQLKIRDDAAINKTFWLTLYVQLLLDFAFFNDGAAGKAQEALLIARQLDNSPLVAHCERFANQTLGVGDEALATLNDSFHRFSEIPENSDEYLMYTPSRLATVLNRNTTMLISATSAVDPGSFEADYLQAKETFPSYSNIGMMASAAGIAAMIRGHKRRAVGLLERAALERSLPIDGFNIRMNLLCAQHNHSGGFDEHEFELLCEEVSSFPFSQNWEYHKVRIATNLLTMAYSSELGGLAWSIVSKSPFLKSYDGGQDAGALREFLIRKRYSHYLRGGSLAGQFGKLVSRSNLFPCIDKDWA